MNAAIEACVNVASRVSVNADPLSTLTSNGRQPYGGRTVNPVNPVGRFRGEGGVITHTPPVARARAPWEGRRVDSLDGGAP